MGQINMQTKRQLENSLKFYAKFINMINKDEYKAGKCMACGQWGLLLNQDDICNLCQVEPSLAELDPNYATN